MNDMSAVIVPKSDQINADDLIAGPMTITIAEVQIRGGQEQPVSIFFEGSEKAFRPCKSMSRVLVQGWGPDANKYVGRSLILYRDPTVKWAGLEVGGIRISHMSHIEREQLMMLTATKGSRKPHKVLPLKDAPAANNADPARKWATAFITQVRQQASLGALDGFVDSKATKLTEMQAKRPELYNECEAAIAERRGVLGLDSFEDDLTADPDFLARIAAATDPADLGLVEQDYRAVMHDLPKGTADAVEAALVARRAELAGEG